MDTAWNPKMTSRKDWLQGWFAGIVVGAVIGGATALVIARLDANPLGIARRATPASTPTRDQQVRVADALAAARAYLRVGNFEAARELYASALQIDCENAEAQKGLLASTVDTPSMREELRTQIRRACIQQS